MPELRTLLDRALSDTETAMDGLAGGQLSPDEWQQAMAQNLLVYHSVAYMLGNESDTLTPDEQALINRIVGDQVEYLNRFADQIAAADDYNPAWASRAALYVGALKGSYARGQFSDWEMPFYPTEDCECGPNCQCNWNVDDQGDGTGIATWVRLASDSCATCKEREARSPYVVQEIGALAND